MISALVFMTNALTLGRYQATTTRRETAMFDDFIAWWTVTANRRHGKPPAVSTLVAMRERLKGIARITQCESAETLATLLSDRHRVVLLLDTLYARQSPGTVRNVLVTLRHFGDYAKAMGWSQGVAL